MPPANTGETRRKLIAFDEETWNALDLYARESMQTIQELADEAFRDLLAKHNRPTDLRAALRKSARGELPDGKAAPAAAPRQGRRAQAGTAKKKKKR